MTDHQAQARALLLTLIEYLDLSVKEPERWPNLESILAAALQAERAQVLEAVVQHCEEEIALHSFSTLRCLTNEDLAIWCREQAKEAP